jgi:serine/threonine-protein kinase
LTRAGGLADPRRVRRSFSIAVWTILVLAAPGAGAQGNPAAAKLFEEGRALADQGKYDAACERFTRSYELERAAGTMLNLGDCAEREGKLRRAWLMYDDAAREYEQTGKAGPARFARNRADALAPKLATVVVRIAEPRARGLTVRIGSREVPPAAEIVERLEAGAVRIEVGAAGREPFSTTANATSGAQVAVEVPALRTMAGGAVAAPPVDRPARSRRQRRRVLIAAGVGGAGALGLATAGLFAITAKIAHDEYKDKQEELGCIVSCTEEGLVILDPYYDRAVRRADLATGFVIGGAALAAGGVILYLTAPEERVTVAPAASSSSVGLLATVRF